MSEDDMKARGEAIPASDSSASSAATGLAITPARARRGAFISDTIDGTLEGLPKAAIRSINYAIDEAPPATAQWMVERSVTDKIDDVFERFPKGFYRWARAKGPEWRNAAVLVLPAFMVNNASNLIGLNHTFGEFLFLKSNGTQLIPDKHRGKYLLYPLYALESARSSIWTKAKLSFSLKELTTWKFYREGFSALLDVEKATKLDTLKLGPKDKLINRFQARSTLFGMTAWLINMVIPEKPDKPEETERMADLMQNNKLAYVGLRLKQAVWIPDWWNHKRQVTGLGIFICGIFSTLGGFRGVRVNEITGLREYWRNWVSVGTGFITFATSLPLLFSVDDDTGYSKFGSFYMVKIPTLPLAIHAKFANRDLGKWWYSAATAVMTGENMFAALVGGAEKKSDGTIVDHLAIRNAARAKARAHKEQLKHQKEGVPSRGGEDQPITLNDTPRTTVAAVDARALAMPERAAAKEARVEA